MILFIVLAVAFISTAVFFMTTNYYLDSMIMTIIEHISLVIMILSIIVVIIMLSVLCINCCSTASEKASMHAEYDALIYKIEATQKGYADVFGLNNVDIVSEIQEWNTKLAKNKTLQKDFWVGIFYPNIYDDFEFIDYNTITFPNSPG